MSCEECGSPFKGSHFGDCRIACGWNGPWGDPPRPPRFKHAGVLFLAMLMALQLVRAALV